MDCRGQCRHDWRHHIRWCRSRRRNPQALSKCCRPSCARIDPRISSKRVRQAAFLIRYASEWVSNINYQQAGLQAYQNISFEVSANAIEAATTEFLRTHEGVREKLRRGETLSEKDTREIRSYIIEQASEGRLKEGLQFISGTLVRVSLFSEAMTVCARRDISLPSRSYAYSPRAGACQRTSPPYLCQARLLPTSSIFVAADHDSRTRLHTFPGMVILRQS